jgi:putative tricarboxylic transport membrane protein
MTAGWGLRLGEGILGGFLLAVGLFIAIEIAGMEVAASTAAVGPKMFPFIVAGGLILIGLLVLREAAFGHVPHEGGLELWWPAVLLISVALMAQLLLVERAGWIIAAAVLFALVARAFGSRRLLTDAVIGLALSGLTFVVFSYGLDLSLPAGLVGELLSGSGDAVE